MSDDESGEPAIPGLRRSPLLVLTPQLAAAVGSACACAALVTTLLWSRGLGTGEALGRATGPFVSGVIAAAVVGAIGRQAGPALWAYAAVTMMFGAYGTFRAVLGRHVGPEPPASTSASDLDDRENSAATQAEIDADLKSVFAKAPSDGAPSVDFERKKLDAVRRAERRSIGSSARFYSVFATTQEGTWILTKELVAAIDELPELDFQRAEDPAQLASQLESWRRLRNAVDAYVAFASTEPARLERVLVQRRAHEAMTRGALKTFRPKMREAAAAWGREAARTDATIRALELLQQRAGKWRARSATEVKFDDAGDQAAFDANRRRSVAADAAP